MKVLLCQTPIGPREPIVFPLGLAYLAGTLKNHEVLCWDPNLGNDPISDLGELLENFEPNLVGLALRNIDSVICSPKVAPRSYYGPFVSLVKFIKEKSPCSKLMVGGAGFSILPKEIMERTPEIDFGVISEGEQAVPRILEDLEHPERVPNTITRKEGKLFFSPRADYIDFDTLPAPSREHFDLSKYCKLPYSMGVQSKRGCIFNCLYCKNPSINGSLIRLRKPQKVIDEIEELADNYNIHEFYFSDPVFNYPPEHANQICQEIIKRHLEIKWQADFRPDYVSSNFMKTAVKSGCEQFNFSPDGASDGAMQILCKNMSVESVVKTAQWAKEIDGAKVEYCFVYDLPSKNMSQYAGLLKLCSKLCRSAGEIPKFGFTRMRIYPDTQLHQLALRKRKIRPDTDLLAPTYYSHDKEIFAHISCSFSAVYPEILRKFTTLRALGK